MTRLTQTKRIHVLQVLEQNCEGSIIPILKKSNYLYQSIYLYFKYVVMC